MKDQKYVSHLVRRLSWDELDEKYIAQLIETARAEDIEGAGLKLPPRVAEDLTTMTLTPRTRTSTRLVARRDMVVCGVKLAALILKVYESHSDEGACEFTPLVKDGDFIPKGGVIANISGAARVMLQAERVMLNFLQRLSGVSTSTAEYVAALQGSSTKLLDTRKTTPSLRVLEKYAFACGGGYNHRIGLFDRVMLKDNHLAAAQAVDGQALADAVLLARKRNPDVAVEVEVDSISQIAPVLEAGADVIMFDNFSMEDLYKGVEIVGDNAWTEVSGGVTLKTLADIGKVGADFVSTAAPVHSSSWIDIGLDS